MKVALSVVMGTALGIVGLGLLIRVFVGDPLIGMLRPARPTAEINLSQTQLVKKIIYAEKDIALRVPGREPRFFGLIQAERLYMNTGRCSAGIDYSRQSFQVMERQDQSIFVRIPPPEIFPCVLLEAGQLWDGSGFVTASTDLSNRLATVAFDELQEQAPKTDILDRARAEALDQAELDMRRLGFTNVRVEFQPGAQ